MKIIPEGSGEDVKYYAQVGADAASKKLLGKTLYGSLINYKLYDNRNNMHTTTYQFQKDYQSVMLYDAAYMSGAGTFTKRTLSSETATLHEILQDPYHHIVGSHNGNVYVTTCISFISDVKAGDKLTIYDGSNSLTIMAWYYLYLPID